MKDRLVLAAAGVLLAALPHRSPAQAAGGARAPVPLAATPATTATAAAAAVAATAPTPAALPASAIAQALGLAQEASARAAPAGARVNASLGALDRRLNPAPCQQAAAFLPPGVPAWGRTRVGLRCTQGPVAWTLYLPVLVQVQAPALSVRTPLAAGSVLAEADLATAWVDWTAQARPPLTDATATAGRTLARPATPGQPLREADLQPRRWFAAGDRVQVLAGGSGFAVAAEGQALGEGRDGQRVRVQMLLRASDGSSSTGPIVQGLAVGERRVALFQ